MLRSIDIDMRPIFIFSIWLLLSCTVLHSQEVPDFLLAKTGKRPFICIDRNSNIHAVWEGFNEGIEYFGVSYGMYDSVWNEIKSPITISQKGWIYNPTIVMNRHAIAVWLEGNVVERYALGRLISLEGDTLTPYVEFDDGESGSITAPRLSFMTDTTLVCVWGKWGELVGQLTNDSLQFIGEKKILHSETSRYDKFKLVRIASDFESPNLMVFWRLQPLDAQQLIGRIFRKDLTPKDTSFVISEIDGVTEIWSPEVSIKSNGGFVVTFTAKTADSICNVYYREYNQNGEPLAECVKINEGQKIYGVNVDKAIDDEDNVIIVWDDKLPCGSPYIRIVG